MGMTSEQLGLIANISKEGQQEEVEKKKISRTNQTHDRGKCYVSEATPLYLLSKVKEVIEAAGFYPNRSNLQRV